jgi:hypothetical protein
VAQGIWGDVWFWSGDFMPQCGTGSITPSVRELRIHEATTSSQTEGRYYFFRRVNTPLVTTVRSDAHGFFQVSLPPGTYSVFSVEDSLLYGNVTDSLGYIESVTVAANKCSEKHFDITYDASYKPSNRPLQPTAPHGGS